MHWNGHAWRIVPGPDRPGKLWAVAGSFANDVWAVGDSGGAPLVESWDGVLWSAREDLSEQPFLGAQVAVAGAVSPARDIVDRSVWVAVRSANDSWLLRYRGGLDHWRIARRGGVNAVAAASDRDAWAVGPDSAAHWNGTRWTNTTVPVPAYAETAYLRDVAIAPGGAWVVGDLSRTVDEHVNYGVVYRRVGGRWKIVFHRSGMTVVAADAAASGDAWAVAVSPYSDWFDEYGLSLMLHWNGSRWSAVRLPPAIHARLDDVAEVSSHDVWAVGTGQRDTKARRAIALHYACLVARSQPLMAAPGSASASRCGCWSRGAETRG